MPVVRDVALHCATIMTSVVSGKSVMNSWTSLFFPSFAAELHPITHGEQVSFPFKSVVPVSVLHFRTRHPYTPLVVKLSLLTVTVPVLANTEPPYTADSQPPTRTALSFLTFSIQKSITLLRVTDRAYLVVVFEMSP